MLQLGPKVLGGKFGAFLKSFHPDGILLSTTDLSRLNELKKKKKRNLKEVTNREKTKEKCVEVKEEANER